jgi:hypothetical protein
VTIKRDTVAPSISLTQPQAGAVYAIGQELRAAYSCADGLSGVASCTGSVPNGTIIVTRVKRSGKFSVQARDEAGNTAISRVSYSVQ